MISFWILVWTPYTLIGAYVYYFQVPEFMLGNMQIALTTQNFQQWYDLLLKVMIIAVSIALLIGISGTIFPMKIPRWSMIIPLLVLFFFLGTFERIREFIRKPYIIGDYMYANALIEEDYPLYKRDGILAHATYASTQKITEENKVQAGRDVFMIACTRCHTTHGINSVVTKFEDLYGKEQQFNIEAMKGFMKSMHNVRLYMPPFPGTDEELDALAHYIKDIRQFPEHIEGAQVSGTPVVPFDKNVLDNKFNEQE